MQTDQNFQQLFHRLNRRHSLRQTTRRVAGQTAVWYQAADSDAVVLAAAQNDADPFWADDWPSSLAIDQHWSWWSAHLPCDPIACDTLEIGCGSGLASLAVVRRGGRVCGSDISGDALLLYRLNMLANGRQPPCRRFDWTSLAASDRCSADQLSSWPAGRFDLVIGADVLYSPSAAAALANSLFRFGATAFVLADPHRPVADAFFERLAAMPCGVIQKSLLTVMENGRVCRVRLSVILPQVRSA